MPKSLQTVFWSILFLMLSTQIQKANISSPFMY